MHLAFYNQRANERISLSEAISGIGPRPESCRNFWALFSWRANSACIDVRDRVFSLVSLTTDGSFPISYHENLASLFWRTSRYFEAWTNISYLLDLRSSLEHSIPLMSAELRNDPIYIRIANIYGHSALYGHYPHDYESQFGPKTHDVLLCASFE